MNTRKKSVSIVLIVMMVMSIISLMPGGIALAATYPALPQVYIDTTYSPPTGNTITVNAGDDLQVALNSAQLGDTIVLQAGATWTGHYTLPNKTSGSGWIYIQSSAYSSLPAPDHRVFPSDAGNMPKIVTPDHIRQLKALTAHTITALSALRLQQRMRIENRRSMDSFHWLIPV